ncbi:N-acetylmuramoyl-L-alanine amidase [Paenibacillus thermoaerophilus]|uniref:N-acetylmuramoyl-L-alanine amidase n=1 Tax=Paenibacillus thermoaerophilus TaxID=1215385 RepID=A0ABW2V266_9BACL|nr:N-acetylmuramoyl-L-alanine amidase [Paenibacillus thermoaerophilus]TMV18138.1 N-acetylmuramoyl-L-alanine amidase [Paenibacillus thermoaerophilus]
MKIMIDPGHGGSDPGAGGNGLQEKDLTLRIAARVGELVRERGADVLYTRTTDTTVGLSERANLANAADADYFLSVHINAGGGTGFESYTYIGTSGVTSDYRNAIHDRVAAVFAAEGMPDRGKKQANFAVLRETRMPAALLEYGFIDHPTDASHLRDPAFIEKLAQATAQGVADAFGLPDAPGSPVPEPKGGVSDWAKDARDWVVTAGISDGTRPKDAVTREEVWTMLHRMSKL